MPYRTSTSAQYEDLGVVCVTTRMSAAFAETADLSDQSFIGAAVVKAAQDLAAGQIKDRHRKDV